MPPLSPLEEIKEKIKKEREMSSVATEEPAQLEELPPVGVSTPTLTQVSSTPKESIGVEPETDVRGMIGAVTRGLTVPAAQSLAGMTVGAVAGPPGMMAGAAVGPLVFGLGDLTIEGVNSYFGTDFETSRGAITKLLDSLGTPKPDTAAERITEVVTEGLSGAGGSAAAFKAAGEIPKIPERAGKIFRFMGEKPIEQTAIGGTAAAASSGAQEAGAGPVVSTLTGLGAAAAIPLTRSGYRAIFPTQEMKQERALERLRGVYQTIFPEESQRQQAIQPIRQATKAADEDVSLMFGEATGNEALLALQRAMEKSSQAVAERRASNIAGVAKKIEKGLADVGASPEEASKFFESEFNYLKQTTDEVEQNLRLAGTQETEQFYAAKKSVDDAEAEYQKGLINSEEAHKKAKSALDDYFEIENKRVTDRRMGELSTQTSDVIQKQKEEASNYATSLYNEVPDVEPFVQPNTKKAIDDLIARTPEGEGGKKDIPKVVRDIYANIVDEDGNLKLKELWEPVDWRQKLNDEIDKSIRTGNKKESKKLLEIKTSIDADLKTLETAYPQIKKANQFYSEYSDIYQSKLAEKAFKEGEDLTALLDKYGKSEEGLLNLRNAILNHPEISSTEVASSLKNIGLRNIDEWVVSKANEAMRKPSGEKKYTSSSLNRWLNQGEGSVIFKVFENDLPESKATIENLISEFENLENSAIQAKKNVDLAKAKELTEGSPVKVAYANAEEAKKLIDESLEKEIKRISQEFNEKTNPSLNPANRFIGADAQAVVGNIMSNAANASTNMTKILEAAAKDTTGKATEGVKNATRRWLNDFVRSTSKSTATKGMVDPVLQIKNLKVSLDKAQQLLGEVSPGVPSPQRQTLEVVFGKNSEELAALDRSRAIVDMIERETTLSTKDILGKDVKSNEVVDTLISIGAIQAANVKGYVAWKMIELMRKFGKTSEKDVKNIFENLLAKSLYDKETAEIAFQPVTKENWAATKRLARNLGIQVRATDFGLEEEKEEKQQEEKTKMGFGFASGKEFPRF
jgi:hypothetical protein